MSGLSFSTHERPALEALRQQLSGNARRSQYHGFVVKRTFSMGLMAAPGTDTILGRLGGDGADQVLSHTRQGYLDHKKTPTSLGLSKDPRHRPAVGS